MDLESEFNEAAAAAKNVKNVDTNSMLKLYGLFKQATVGPCNIPKPGFFDFVGKQKWEAWSSLGGMSKNEAMEKYIDLVNSLPREESGAAGTKDKIMGVSVSCMANTDTVMQDEDKTIFDWLKEGRPEKVLNLLNQDRDLLNQADESGMCLVHWAADRGDLPMLESLINQGANINAQDAEGQTALHYAYSCGHEKCVDLLVKQGADTEIRDAAGVAPAELAYKDS